MIIDQLDKLAEMRAQHDAIRLHYDELRAKVITPEIQAELDDIDAEQQSALEAASQGIDGADLDFINSQDRRRGKKPDHGKQTHKSHSKPDH